MSGPTAPAGPGGVSNRFIFVCRGSSGGVVGAARLEPTPVGRVRQTRLDRARVAVGTAGAAGAAEAAGAALAAWLGAAWLVSAGAVVAAYAAMLNAAGLGRLRAVVAAVAAGPGGVRAVKAAKAAMLNAAGLAGVKEAGAAVAAWLGAAGLRSGGATVAAESLSPSPVLPSSALPAPPCSKLRHTMPTRSASTSYASAAPSSV